MQETPEQIAARLMAPASQSALWSYDQMQALLVQAIREERKETKRRPARAGKIR